MAVRNGARQDLETRIHVTIDVDGEQRAGEGLAHVHAIRLGVRVMVVTRVAEGESAPEAAFRSAELTTEHRDEMLGKKSAKLEYGGLTVFR